MTGADRATGPNQPQHHALAPAMQPDRTIAPAGFRRCPHPAPEAERGSGGSLLGPHTARASNPYQRECPENAVRNELAALGSDLSEKSLNPHGTLGRIRQRVARASSSARAVENERTIKTRARANIHDKELGYTRYRSTRQRRCAQRGRLTKPPSPPNRIAEQTSPPPPNEGDSSETTQI